MVLRKTWLTINRVTAAILGGYAFTWGLTAFGIASMVAMGISYDEAETGMSMIAFLVFLALFLWAFISASMLRVWLLLGGGAIVMRAAALMLQSSLIS